MVSKSKILGKSALVFVTVGSTGFQFDRLFSSLDQALEGMNKKFFLVVQAGSSQYQWKYRPINVYSYLSPAKIIYFFKNAEKIVSHAGPASIYLAINYAKYAPLFVPRSPKFNEHVDNHQLYFINFLRRQLPKKVQRYFVSDSQIKPHIESYLKESPRKNTSSEYGFPKLNKNKVIDRVGQFIENTSL